MLAGGRP